MKKIIPVWKRVGATPLEAIQEFRAKNPEYEKETISYAGRLDPMAEGVLILLIGDENKNRKKYENLKKEYETEIVLGITTDTFDALGIIQKTKVIRQKSLGELTDVVNSFVGKRMQKYPPYSSKPVKGKPLYWWARRNRLSEIEIPEKEIKIYSIEIKQVTVINGKKLAEQIQEKINLVRGDFRQEEILKQWENFGKRHKKDSYQVLKLKIACSSGTYIRHLASDIGEKLVCGAFCLSIFRTRVGVYNLQN